MTSLFTKGRVIGLIVVVGLVVALLSLKSEDASISVSPKNNKLGETTGTLACLPTKDKNAGCILGLHAENGDYYALDTSLMRTGDASITAEDTIVVSGDIVPLVSFDDSTTFEADGLIYATSIAKKQPEM